MLNFRYHIVSLVAVFLALGIGVLIGAGALDRPTVEFLQNRINTVEANADARRLENDQLREQVDELDVLLDATGPFVITDRLGELKVLVVAVRGVDADIATSTVGLARQGGADAPGVLWLEPKWLLEDADDRQALQDLVETNASRRAAVRERAFRVLTNRLATGGGVLDTDPLNQLSSAGFVAYEAVTGSGVPLAELGGPDTLVVFVGGAGGSLNANQALAPFATGAANVGLGLVAGEIASTEDEGPARGAFVRVIRDDEALSVRISTVDDLDRPSGAVVALLAIADLARGVVGHYGFGDGANGAAPDWWQP